MPFVYILYSISLDSYYVGSTETSIELRLEKHLRNHSGYTGRAKDWTVVYYESFETKALALQRELFIKRKKSRKFIENLINKCD